MNNHVKQIILVATLAGIASQAMASIPNPDENKARVDVIKKQKSLLKLNHYVKNVNPNISPNERRQLVNHLIETSHELDFPSHFTIDNKPVNKVAFLTAMVQVESTFKRTAVSSSNAQGYMQLKQSTVKWLDTKMGYQPGYHKLFHTRTNLEKGVDYINHLSGFMKNLRFVCLAYNAGPGSVKKGQWHEKYWRDVLRNYRRIVALKMPTENSKSQLAQK